MDQRPRRKSGFKSPVPALGRTLIVVGGVLVACCFYSYGTFHALIPTKTAVLAVAHCAAGAPATPGMIADGGEKYCLDPSGDWRIVQSNDAAIFGALAIALGSTLLAAHGMACTKRLLSSLLGTVLLGSAFFGIPLGLYFLNMNFVEGTLASIWALRVVLYGLIGGALFGLVIWFTVIRARTGN